MDYKWLLVCIQVLPIALFVTGALGVFGIITIGPRELPKKDPLNLRMSLSIILVGLGIFLSFTRNNIYSVIGTIAAIGGMVTYSILYKEARKNFLAIADKDWVIDARRKQFERFVLLKKRRLEKKANRDKWKQ